MIWRTSGIVALQQESVFQLGGIRRFRRFFRGGLQDRGRSRSIFLQSLPAFSRAIDA